MSQFNSTYLGRRVVVDYHDADDPFEDLSGVIISYCDTGEQIDYDDMPALEWVRFHEEVKARFSDSEVGIMHTKTQKALIHAALIELGSMFKDESLMAMYHHRIFGIYMAAIKLNAMTDDLSEIEGVSTHLWCWGE